MTPSKTERLSSLAPVFEALGLQVLELSWQAAGAPCQVHRVHTRQGDFALRLPVQAVSLLPDAFLRQQLTTWPIAAPVATHHGFAPVGFPWALDHWMAGETCAPESLPLPVCSQIGEVLAALHALPGTGHGPLLDSLPLQGKANTPEAGLRQRWRWAFPFAGEGLDLLPDLRPALQALAPDILALNQHAATVLHADLHSQQFLQQHGKLVAVLDFADGMMGPAVWDVAHFLYFHGKHRTRALLQGHGQPDLLEGARVLQVSLCTHYIGKFHHQRNTVRLKRAREKLQKSLDALVKNRTSSRFR